MKKNKSKRPKRARPLPPPPPLNTVKEPTLEFLLLEALQGRINERGGQLNQEGPVDALYRIIFERDQALLTLGLDRLRSNR